MAPDSEREFSKYHGLGNDFLVVELGEAQAASFVVRDAIAWCDRHRGIGADGVLLLSRGADGLRMRVINADGSTAQMCGNGLRCLALHVYRRGWVGAASFDVLTDAGPHRCEVLVDAGAGDASRRSVEVAMAVPSLLPEEVPVAADAPLIDAPWQIGGTVVRLTAVSVGNPHAVTFDDLGGDGTRLGEQIGADSRFPQGVNVGLARLRGDALRLSIDLRVFERGAGWTEACGTGACAAVVAAVETGRLRRGQPVAVRLPGGILTVTVGERHQRIRLRGEACHVFDGVLPVDRAHL